MRVGFVGLGAMGRPMARNLLSHGHSVIGFDKVPEAAEALRPYGGLVAADQRELAESADVVVTMLPHPSDVEDLLLGTGRLSDWLRAGSTFVDMSTGDPQTAQRIANALAEKDIEAIDCPVGRTQDHAEAGTLLLLAGGSEVALETVRPVLMCMGEELVHCGGPGMGQVMKLVNNMLSLVVAEAVGEALAIGLRSGLTLELIRLVTSRTMAQTAQLDVGLANKALTGDLTPGFALRLAEKDIRLATELAERLGITVPVAEQTLRRCVDLRAAGHADSDFGILATSQLSERDQVSEGESASESDQVSEDGSA